MIDLSMEAWLLVFVLFFQVANLVLQLQGRRIRKGKSQVREEAAEDAETVEVEEEEPAIDPVLAEALRQAGGSEDE